MMRIKGWVRERRGGYGTCREREREGGGGGGVMRGWGWSTPQQHMNLLFGYQGVEYQKMDKWISG